MESSPRAFLIVGCTLPAGLAAQAPAIDYHQHLFSPAAAALVTGSPSAPGIDARRVIGLLDSAGIRRAVVLSVAYTWGKATREPVADEYERVRAENDWTAEQVALYPDRLLGFCSVNPLKPYALEELARCSRDPRLRSGLKLHFGNSDVDLDNPDNVSRVREVLARANFYGMAIVAHIRTSIDNQRRYGADQARVVLDELLPAAPDVPVQFAHLAGAGGYEPATDSALGVFADAIARGDGRLRNVWFDAAVVVRPGMPGEVLQQIATRIRAIGVERVLYGSDAAASPATYPRVGWDAFRRLPLTAAEFGIIAGNVAPHAGPGLPIPQALQPQRPGTLTGRVAANGRPIAGAEVGIVDSPLRTITSYSGTFVLAGVPAGPVTVFVRAIGFLPTVTRLRIPEGAPAPPQPIELTAAAQLLPELRAEARWAKPARLAHTTRYDDFYRRRRSGLGTFLTREDIERAAAMRSFELLRGLPGIQVAWNPPGVPGTRVRFARCEHFPPRVSVWIDGRKQPFSPPPPPPDVGRRSDLDLDPVLRWQSETWREWLELFDAVKPSDIEAVEVFRGVAQIPAEFLDDSCAAVAIWTRDGGTP